MDIYNLVSFAGIFVLISFAWVLSADKKNMNWRVIGWGAWSVECGWTQGWITTVLALRELNLNLWNLTAESEIGEVFDPIRQQMMPDDQIALPESNKVSHAAIGASVQLASPAHAWYPGLGSGGLVDGLIYYSKLKVPGTKKLKP